MKKKTTQKNSKTAPLTEIESQIAALEAQKQATLALAREQEAKERAALNEKLKELPTFLGLPDLVTVRKFVNIYAKHNTAYPTHSRARITEETKANIRLALRADKPKQLNVIAQEYGVSAPTVFAIKKSLGMVKTREKAAAR